MECLRIKNWAANFENNRSKEIEKLLWVPIPNKLAGDSYSELVDHPNGTAHFGIWNAIVLVASKCNPRGTLVRSNGQPHAARSMSRITALSEAMFDEAIPRLIEIGWLETITLEETQVTTEPAGNKQTPQAGAIQPQAGAGERLTNGTEKNGTGINNDERRSVVDVLLAEGFQANDPILTDPNCTLDQVSVAIANANAYPPDKLGDRRGYIATAIRKGYRPSAKAKRAMDAHQRREAEVQRRQKDRDDLVRVQAEAAEAAEMVAAMTDDRFRQFAEWALECNPKMRSWVKVERSNAWLSLKIRELVKEEKSHATACG